METVYLLIWVWKSRGRFNCDDEDFMESGVFIGPFKLQVERGELAQNCNSQSTMSKDLERRA